MKSLLISLILVSLFDCVSIESSKKYYVYKQDKAIDFRVKNNCDSSLYFYLSLKSWSDTGWVNIISNIENLDRNEIFNLSEIKPNQTKFKFLKITKIPRRYFFVKNQKLVITLHYSRRKKVISNSFQKKEIEIFIKNEFY